MISFLPPTSSHVNANSVSEVSPLPATLMILFKQFSRRSFLRKRVYSTIISNICKKNRALPVSNAEVNRILKEFKFPDLIMGFQCYLVPWSFIMDIMKVYSLSGSSLALLSFPDSTITNIWQVPADN